MSFYIWVLQGIAFLDLLAVSLIIPLLSSHVRNLGGNHIYIGLLGSIYAGFQLISGPLMGSLSDIKGQRYMLIITLLVSGIAYIVMGLTSSIIIILISRAVLGIFKQTQMLTKAILPDYEKNAQKQSSVYGKMAAISGLGITLGPILGGHILEADPDNGFMMIGIIVGIIFIFNTALVYLLLPNMVSRKKTSNVKLSKNIFSMFLNSTKQSVIELYKVEWTDFWDIFMFKAFIGFAMSIYYSNYSLYLKSQYELSPKYIGYVISFQGVIGSISSFLMGFINSFYKTDTDYSQRNFHVFLLLTTSLIGLILSFNIYVYSLWLIPLAVGNAIGRLVTLEMVLIRSHGQHRGTLIGASNSVRSLTGVVAPMISGLINEIFGVSYVIYVSMFSTMVGLILSYLNKSRRFKVE